MSPGSKPSGNTGDDNERVPGRPTALTSGLSRSVPEAGVVLVPVSEMSRRDAEMRSEVLRPVAGPGFRAGGLA